MRWTFSAVGCVALVSASCMRAPTESPAVPATPQADSPADAQADQIAPDAASGPPEADRPHLDGSWGIVSAERAGSPLLFDRASVIQTFAGDQVSFGKPGAVSTSKVALNLQTEPHQLDTISGPRVAQGIFRIDGDVLTICSSELPSPRPDTFTTSAQDGRFLMVFRRMQPANVGQKVSAGPKPTSLPRNSKTLPPTAMPRGSVQSSMWRESSTESRLNLECQRRSG